MTIIAKTANAKLNVRIGAQGFIDRLRIDTASLMLRQKQSILHWLFCYFADDECVYSYIDW